MSAVNGGVAPAGGGAAAGRVRALLGRVDSLLRPLPVAAALAVLALGARVRLFAGRHEATPGGDSDVWLALATGLANGDGFAGDLRQPGYPAFLAALDVLVPGRREDAAVIVQHLLGVAVAVGVLLLAWRWFGRTTALIAGVIAALLPSMIYLEDQIWADFPFGVVALAGAAVLIEGLLRRRLVWLAGAGALFGLATYVKGEGLFLAAGGALAALAVTGSLTRRARPALVAAAVVGLVAVVAVVPWVVRNELRYGHATLSIAGGLEPFNRAFEVDGLPVPTDTREGRLVMRVEADIAAGRLITHAEFARRMGPRLSEYERLFARTTKEPGSFNLAHQSYQALRLSGLSDEQAYNAQRDLALTAWRRAPLRFVRGTFDRVRGTRADLRVFQPYQNELSREIEYPRLRATADLTRAGWFAGRGLAEVAWLLSFAAFAVLALPFLGSPRARVAATVLLSLWIVKAVGMGMLSRQDWRYDQQLDAMAWTLVAAAAVLVVTLLRRALADGGGAQTPADRGGEPADLTHSRAPSIAGAP